MRILLVSDLHYNLPQLDWVVGAGPEFDLVVVAGDSLNIASPVPLDAQSVVILQYLGMLDGATTVAVSSGNHDLTGPDAAGEQSALWLAEAQAAGIPTDGDSLLVGDTLVTVCPWWDGPKTREVVGRQLAEDAPLVGDRLWIWVYHAPPDESPTSWTGKRHYGDTDLVAWIEEHRPGIVLSGHVHQAPWASEGGWSDRIGSTLVLNAGRQGGQVPTRIEIDTDAGTAQWFSAEGVDDRTFAAVSDPTV